MSGSRGEPQSAPGSRPAGWCVAGWWDGMSQGLTPGRAPFLEFGLFLRKDERLAFLPRMGGKCLLSDRPGCRPSRGSFSAPTGLTLGQDPSCTSGSQSWNSRLGGSSGSLSLPPDRVNGRTFAEIEITAHMYPDFCPTVPGRKLGALRKPLQALSICPGGTEAGGRGLPVFPASSGDAKAWHWLTRRRVPLKTCPLPRGGVPVLRVNRLSRAAPGPGQQTKSGCTCACPARGREMSHCPRAVPAPPATTTDPAGTGCLVGHSGCAMARLVGPAAILVLLCLAVGLEASPELSGYLRKVLKNHTAHTCDGEQLLIVCPRKTTISILGAFYGRRVPSTNLCPSPGNASQESTECTSGTAHLKLLAECQDKQWCQFSLHSQVFGPDPCPGTHKYLITSYKCRPGNHRIKTVCENDKLRLQCRPKSILAIYSANYGRFLRGKPECDALNTGGPHIECLAPDALRRVFKKCHRKGNCTVAADEATFGDPCLPGMKKQLRVSYTCVPKQLLEEVGPDTSDPFLLSDYMHGVPEKVGLYFLCGVSGGLMLLLCIISPKTAFLQEVGEALKDPELGSSSELGRTKLRDEQDEDLPDDSSSDSSFRRLTRTYRATDSIFSPELTAAMEGAVDHQGYGGEEIWMPKESSPYAIHKIKSATK
ncbi:protein eva-1 homolog C-like isoform X3 [Manacus candei]|uniref:protein eva-1 homolog C-like isoform X3 n=1 Tax=Manacus candei TaxID=415023 RepID=UPI00222693D7|nr:protein eva-1 homolog C-like isoform X3 [Manacus candei]